MIQRHHKSKYKRSIEKSALIILLVSGYLWGGVYQSYSDGVGSSNTPNPCVVVNQGAVLNMNNTSVLIDDETNGTVYGVLVKAGGQANINNSKLQAASPYGLNVHAVDNSGTMVMQNCDIDGLSNYTANAQKTDYASSSRGVVNNGTLTLKNCSVLGTHAGMRNLGALYVDGGTFEGYGHGGIYFVNSTSTAYVKNATLRKCEMPTGYYDDGIAGTNRAGFYIGGANNIIVYMDTCEFYGDYYPFVIKSGMSGCHLYVSNSTVLEGFSRYIRLDSSGNKLHIGSGNNFDIVTCYREGYAEETGVDYSSYFPEY